MNARPFLERYYRLLKAAGLPRCKFHTLRHSFATLLLEANESPKILQTLLGHSRISITMDVYAHVSSDTKANAVAKLAAALHGGR